MARPLPPLSALRAFEATARHLSFSRAAAELHVTPAALSHQVRGLEELLGRKLFVRKSRTIELTATGSELYPGLRAGFDNLREAVDRIARQQRDDVLVVSASPGLTAKWLVPRLYRFLQAAPHIEVRISATLAFANLTSDGIDVAMRLSTGVHPGLYVEKLMDETVLPLCSRKLLEGPGRLRRPQDLSRFNLIHIELPMVSPGIVPTWADWMRLAGVARLDATRGLRFDATDHALEAAAEGAGVVLSYKAMASEDIRSGRLVSPFGPELPIVGRAYHFACAAGREKEHKIACFRDWLLGEVRSSAGAPEVSRGAGDGRARPSARRRADRSGRGR